MQEPIISVSGLRGIIGQSLAPTTVMAYVAAYSSQLEAGPIVVTRDGRSSGNMLASAISAALTALGRDVLYGDVAATPTTGILVRNLGAAGGIQISASHNPPEYNGLKLFGGNGRVLPADAGQRVLQAMNAGIAWVDVHQLGTQIAIDDTTSEHLNRVLATVDIDAIRRKQFRVVLDSNHGAGSVLGRKLLDSLATRSLVLGGCPDGQFEHPPEPTKENLQSVCQAARENQADVVFCQDPDADRLAVITGDGTYIGEECTLALTLKNRLSQQPGNCVINCATSRMSIDIARELGGQCHISAVGEANVCDLMTRIDAVYGGEGNGGPIDPRVGMVRDSFVAMAQILEMMASRDQSILQLVGDLPRYAIHKAKANVDRSRMAQIMERLQREFGDAEFSTLDGLRLDWSDSWLLVRPSNTEPIVRIIAESVDPSAAAELARRAAKIIAG